MSAIGSQPSSVYVHPSSAHSPTTAREGQDDEHASSLGSSLSNPSTFDPGRSIAATFENLRLSDDGPCSPSQRVCDDINAKAVALLHRSAREGKREIVAYLLDSGIPVDALIENNISPLHSAALGGDLPTMECILTHGASVFSQTAEGDMPMQYAIAGDHVGAFQLLLRRGSPLQKIPSPNTAVGKKLEELRNVLTPVSINVAAASRDCGKVLTGAANGDVSIWDTGTLQSKLLLKHPTQIISVAIAADGTLGIASASDKKIFVLNLERPDEQEPLQLKGYTNAARSVHISDTGERALTVGGDEVRVWELQNKPRIPSYLLEGHTEPVSFAHMTPNGMHVLTLCEDGNVRYWNLAGPKIALFPQMLPKLRSKIVSICMSDDGRLVAIAYLDHTIHLVELKNPKIAYLVGSHSELITSMCIKGKMLLTGSRDTIAKIWDISRLDSIGCLRTLEGHTGYVTTTIITRDGNHVITGSNKTLKVWDLLHPSQPPRELSGHTRLITSVCAAPDGSQLVTRSADQTVKVWKTFREETIIPEDLVTLEKKFAAYEMKKVEDADGFTIYESRKIVF